jgi:hypothetical protein
MAQSRHAGERQTCPLSGVERTSASSQSRVFRFLRRPSRPSALHPALASRAPVRVYLFIYIQKTDIAP